MPRLTKLVADTVDHFAALNAALPRDTPPMKDCRILDLLDEVAALTEQVATLTARAEQWQRANGGNDEPE